MRILIVGCGYVGLPLGRALRQAGHDVSGLRRDSSAAPVLQEAGIEPIAADITDLASLQRLPAPFDWVVNCAASGGGGVEGYRRVYLEGNRNLLRWLEPYPPQRFIYTSSTSVYGQNDGAWVNEESTTEPGTETGEILVETERLLLSAQRESSFPAMVLRLAGIYGPGRGYWLKQFRSGEARLEGDGSRYLNMIHRDDVVGAIIAALEGGTPGEIYNVVDDEPVSQLALFEWLSAKLNKPMPPAADTTTVSRRRGVTNKRISNRRLKEQLGYRLNYPTFREGFSAELN